MKIQLDTDAKTIKLEDEVVLSKLIETLDRLLPNKEWKKFILQTNTTITHWHEPYIIEKYVQPWRPNNPWQPWYYASTGKTTAEYKAGGEAMQLKSGVYNVEA